jgi:hypothetical protein
LLFGHTVGIELALCNMIAFGSRGPGHVPNFEIFKGRFADQNAVWVESVKGLAAANERMKQIAADKPGAYFVFSPVNHTVLAIIDTTYLMRAPNRPEKNTGVA